MDETLSVIMDRFGVSRRQAYRYIEEALRIKRTVPVPERKVVFTVKVPESLVSLIRHVANATGESLSVIVTQAPEGISEEKGVWLKSIVRFRCFTATIVWAMRRSRRSTGCLFRRRYGRTG